MAAPLRIVALAGSTRRESLNRKFLDAAVGAVRGLGADVTLLDLKEYSLPLYDGDLEDTAGLPANATKLIELIKAHDGLLIAAPEYNGLPTPLLKNTLDWCTRGDDDPFGGKVAAVLSASPGPFGGGRGQVIMQQLLTKLGCHVVPLPCVLPQADKAFDAAGALTNAHAQRSVAKLASALVELTRKIHGA